MKKIISVFIIFSILSSLTSAFASGFSNYGNGKDITRELILEKSAVYIEEDNSIFLCPANSYVMGNAVFPFEIDKNFSLSFDYKIGGGSSADGIAFNFFAKKVSTSNGGYLGVDGAEGYAVELDTFQNGWDADSSHVALVSGKTNNHLASEYIENIRDNEWHNVRIDVEQNLLSVYIDGSCVLTHNQSFNTTGRIAYFTAATGARVDNHYIRNVCYASEAEFENNITINRYGKAYARFVIKDKKGNPIRGARLKYMLSGYSNPMYTQTDFDGVAIIETPYLTGENVQRNFDVTFPDIATQKSKYSFSVNISDLSYSHTWEGKLSAGGQLSAGYEGGFKFGPVDSKASLASLTLEGKAAKTMSVTDSYDSGARNLSIAVSQNFDLAGDAGAGAFAEGSIGKYKAELSPIKICLNASYGASGEVGLNIDNFSPENEEHISQIGYFLLDSAMPQYGTNVLLKLISHNIFGTPYNEMKGSLNTRVGAGGYLGAAEFKSELTNETVMTAELAGANYDSFYGYSFGTDKDNNRVYNSVATVDAGASILTFSATGDNDIEIGAETYGINASINEMELSAKTANGVTDELAIKMVEMSHSGGALWYEENTSYYKEFTFSDGAARAAAKKNDKVNRFTQGRFSWFNIPEMKDAAKDLLTSNYEADYSRYTSVSKGVDLDIGIGLKVLAGAGVNLGFSAIESVDYETENGKTVGGSGYILSKSYPGSYITQRHQTFEDIFMKPVDYLNKQIDKQVVTQKGTAEKCVRNEKAAVSGKTKRNVGLTGVTKRPGIETFSILTVDNSNVSSSNTVGDPYVVSFYDDSDNYIEEISDDDIVLTLSFDAQDLAAAGISDTAEALNALKIYRWDNNTGAYTFIGGNLNFEESEVSAVITKSGQYILAVDQSAPEIINFEVSTGTTPEISAIIRDMSGVETAVLKIDGVTVVDSNNFKACYNTANSLFSYTPKEALSCGEHTLELSAKDTAGNYSEEVLKHTFTVNTTAPEITKVSVPEVVTDGKLVLTAETNGTPTSVVANIRYKDADHSYTMTSEQGIWTATIDDIPSNTVISASVFAYDAYGNTTESDSYEIINFGKTTDIADLGIFDVSDGKLYAAIANSGEKVSGKIFAAGYDDSYNLKDVRSKAFTFDSGYTAFDIEIDSQCKEYKLFFWNDDMEPVSSPSYKLNN